MIGDDIRISIMTVNGNQVRIGIEAPRDVVVDREEIYERKKRNPKLTTTSMEEITA